MVAVHQPTALPGNGFRFRPYSSGRQTLGWHQFTCPVVIVGGTNGKGSCVRFLESIYTAAGYRVGAFTSPHLMRFNERIRVANAMVDDAEVLRLFP